MPSIALEHFDVPANLYGGQSFLWRPGTDYWNYGVLEDTPTRLRYQSGQLEFQGVDSTAIQRHLRLSDNLNRINAQLAHDPIIAQAIASAPGLRLLRLEPWEGLMSFVCGSFSSIPRITKKVQNLCSRFGEPLAPFHGTNLHALPEPRRLARASLSQLRACNLGYRDKYLKGVAQAVERGDVDPSQLESRSYRDAREQLLELPGVGDKVADCICLFGLGKTEAFPIDVWIERALRAFYGKELKQHYGTAALTYARLSQFARDRFGPLAGYAQNYLFTHARRTLPRGS